MTAAVSPYAYLTHPGEWTYRFAAAVGASPLLVFNDADAYGCLWACDQPEGAAAAAASTPMDNRQYGDGSFAGETTFEPRVLTWEGTTTCPDLPAVLAAQARLRAVASTRVPVLYTEDGYPPMSLWLRATGAPKMRTLDGLLFEWSFTMVAEDPLWFDAAELLLTDRTIMLPQTPPGRVYNRIYNYIYGLAAAAESGRLTVTNAGDEWAQATYTITGPVTNPVIVNATTGEFLGLTVTLTALDTLVADTSDELITLNGNTVYVPRTVGSVFPRIAPGPNDLRWSADTINTTARLSVATASTRK